MKAFKDAGAAADSTWDCTTNQLMILPFGDLARVTATGVVVSTSAWDANVHSESLDYTGLSDDEPFTVVGVASISAEPATVCVGNSNVAYTITTAPTGFEYMVSYTPADTSTPGVKEVVATCGSSAATCTVTAVKVEIIELSCPKASNTPQQFEEHKVDFDDPCATNGPCQALVIFHKDARDASFVVQDFDVTFNAHVFPPSVIADQLKESWVKVDGPNSGSFNRTDTFDVKYQNPKKGGVYKFEFDLDLFGCDKSGATLLLPLGGPDCTTYLNSEFQRYEQWLSDLKSSLSSYSKIVRWLRLRYYVAETVAQQNYKYETYEEGLAPCKRWCCKTATIGNYVFSTDQMGNFMYAYVCARAQIWFNTAWLGGQVVAIFDSIRRGSLEFDSPDDQAAYTAGYAYGQNTNNVFTSYLTLQGSATPSVASVADMQDEKAKRAWPSEDVLPSSKWKAFPTYLP